MPTSRGVSLRTVRESAAEGGEFVITGGSSTLQGGDVKCISGTGGPLSGSSLFALGAHKRPNSALDALTAPTGPETQACCASARVMRSLATRAVRLACSSALEVRVLVQLSVSLSERGPGSLQVRPRSGCGGTTSGSAARSRGRMHASGDASASGNGTFAGNAQSDGGDICFRVRDTTNPLTESNAALSLQAGEVPPVAPSPFWDPAAHSTCLRVRRLFWQSFSIIG